VTPARFIRWFRAIGIADVPLVGGRNASLGEMDRELTPGGIRVPNGFAVTADAYRHFVRVSGLSAMLRTVLADLNTRDLVNRAERGHRVREAILAASLPSDLQKEIASAHADLCAEYGPATDVAVRFSATAEDLPSASFAGPQESYLNVRVERALLDACHHCLASLFTDRAISYRADKGFDHFAVARSSPSWNWPPNRWPGWRSGPAAASPSAESSSMAPMPNGRSCTRPGITASRWSAACVRMRP
jgi:pyruvate,water dikinase